MIGGPVIDCVCDSCGEEQTVKPEYKYKDYSGNNGFYDCDDKAIIKILENSHSWTFENGNLNCEDCSDV